MSANRENKDDQNETNVTLTKLEPTQISSSLLSASKYNKELSSEKNNFKPKTILRKKVVIVGDETVGKTSIIQMLTLGGSGCNKNYVMNTETELSVLNFAVPSTDVIVDLFLYDVPGQNTFHQGYNASKCWENANYILCIFDVSCTKSLHSCINWIKSVRTANNDDSNQIPGLLLANKIDLREGGIDARSEVDRKEGEDFASQNNLEYFECSALMGIDTENVFHFIASDAWKRYDTKS